MITVKQVLENYDILTEKADNDSKNLVALVHAGLLDESKLPILKRAMSKSAINMTEAEKKALHNLVESISSSIISEKKDYLSKLDTSRRMGYPPDKDIPAVIILKRKAIRVYPDNQKVALYYSQALDRYISIPYGRNSKALDMTMNEEVRSKRNNIRAVPVIQPTSPKPSETQQTIAQFRGQDKSNKSNMTSTDSKVSAGDSKEKSSDDRLAQIRGMTAKERAAAGVSYKDAIKAIVSTNAPASAQVGTAIGIGLRRLVRLDRPQPQPSKASSPTQQTSSLNPQQRVIGGTRAVPQPNRPVVKESFRKHLEEKRQEKLDEVSWEDIKDGAKKAAEIAGDVTGVNDVVSAVGKAREGDYSGAAWDAAKGVGKGLLTVGTGGAGLAAVTGARVGLTALKAGRSVGNAARRATVAARTSRGGKIAGGIVRGATKVAGAGARLAARALAGGSGGEGDFKKIDQNHNFGQINKVTQVGKTETDPAMTAGGTAVQTRIAGFYKESNNLNIFKQMVEHNISSHIIHINETSITINNRVAKKVVNVYESLNRQNKKKIEKMLNEDALSFKKAINFAIKA